MELYVIPKQIFFLVKKKLGKLLFTLMHLLRKFVMCHSLCLAYSANSLYFTIVYVIFWSKNLSSLPFVFCHIAVEVVMIVVVVVAIQYKSCL